MSSFRRSRSSHLIATAALLAATATLTACPEEDTRLFDEEGVWTLEQYSLDGGPYTDIAQNRKNRFLLRFKSADKVVAAAACHEQNTDADVNSSNCTNAALSTWTCQCFSYTYDNDRMVWQEFAPGETPPPVGAPGADGETGGGETGAHELFLAAPMGTSSTYEFGPLPLDLFNSDGQLSKYIFQQKAVSVWTDTDLDMDGVLDLEACSMSCFPSEG
jgi:hypothetical protein